SCAPPRPPVAPRHAARVRAAFTPVPPMSMASVRRFVGAVAILLASDMALRRRRIAQPAGDAIPCGLDPTAGRAQRARLGCRLLAELARLPGPGRPEVRGARPRLA